MEDRNRREGGIYAVERRSKHASARTITVVLTVAAIACGVVWLLFWSSYFVVSRYDIQGLKSVSRGEVEADIEADLDHAKWHPGDARNIFLLNPQALANQLKDQIFAQNVTVDKQYPNVLRLNIEERQRSVMVSSNDQLLTVDTNGVVENVVQLAPIQPPVVVDASSTSSTSTTTTAPMPSTPYQVQLYLTHAPIWTSKLPPLIQINLPEEATTTQQVTDADTVKKLIEAFQAIADSGIHFRYLTSASFDERTIYVVTDKGYNVILDIGSDLGPQLTTYQKFIQHEPKGMVVSQYIDARVPGKVFVR